MVCVEPLVILSVIFGYLMLSISGRCSIACIAFIPPFAVTIPNLFAQRNLL